MSKAWQRERTYGRRIGAIRHIRDRILIVCEGGKTEPNYFRKFPVNIDLVEVDVQGEGANTLSLVKKAIAKGQRAAKEGKPYNQIWCVFDKDSFPSRDFNKAIAVARRNHIRTAYSNQCFELWYLLHYHFIDAAIDRHDYTLKLTECMEEKYKKNDEGMYKLLKNRQAKAIQHAKALMSRYIYCNPAKDDPSTTVHELVEALNAFLQRN